MSVDTSKVKFQVNLLGSWRNVLLFDETAEAEAAVIEAAARMCEAAPGTRFALLYPDGHREHLEPQDAPKAKSKLEAHLAYMARWKGNRQAMTTPCCMRELEVPAPEELGISWDSLVECPHCGGMFMEVVFRDTARGFIPTVDGRLLAGPTKGES